MLKGFRTFISRGNVIDLAVGVIIGAAFAGIVDSLTKDIIGPILGKFGGQPNFEEFKPFGIGVGNFINAVISFLIKAAGLYFLIVLPFNRFAARLMAPPPPAAPAGPPPTEVLLAEIRDTLKNRLPPTSAEIKPAL
jgi:large conductance mechanosensitive channel